MQATDGNITRCTEDSICTPGNESKNTDTRARARTHAHNI